MQADSDALAKKDSLYKLFLQKANQVLAQEEQAQMDDPLVVDVGVCSDDDLVENYQALQDFMKENILNHQCHKHRQAFGHCWNCCRLN